MSFDDLRKITLDVDDVDVELAIHNALRPAGEQRADHFVGLKAAALKRLLKRVSPRRRRTAKRNCCAVEANDRRQHTAGPTISSSMPKAPSARSSRISSCSCASTPHGRVCWPSINSTLGSSSGSARIGATKNLMRAGLTTTSHWFGTPVSEARTSLQIRVTSAGRCKSPRGITWFTRCAAFSTR